VLSRMSSRIASSCATCQLLPSVLPKRAYLMDDRTSLPESLIDRLPTLLLHFIQLGSRVLSVFEQVRGKGDSSSQFEACDSGSA
jgi:hypothetical protein